MYLQGSSYLQLYIEQHASMVSMSPTLALSPDRYLSPLPPRQPEPMSLSIALGLSLPAGSKLSAGKRNPTPNLTWLQHANRRDDSAAGKGTTGKPDYRNNSIDGTASALEHISSHMTDFVMRVILLHASGVRLLHSLCLEAIFFAAPCRPGINRSVPPAG